MKSRKVMFTTIGVLIAANIVVGIASLFKDNPQNEIEIVKETAEGKTEEAKNGGYIVYDKEFSNPEEAIQFNPFVGVAAVTIPLKNNLFVKGETAKKDKEEKTSKEDSKKIEKEMKEKEVHTHYVVKKGDNFTKIARENNQDVDKLIALNDGKTNLKVGQKIKLVTAIKESEADVEVRKETVNYVVKKGDTLSKISKKYNQPIAVIKKNNPSLGKYLKIGEKLKISVGNKVIVKKANVGQVIKHSVKKGESLYSIAKKYGADFKRLQHNNAHLGQYIKVGDTVIVVKDNSVVHHVKRGDTLSKIAKFYKVSIKDLKKDNKLSSNTLYAGRKLIVKNPKVKLSRLKNINYRERFGKPVKYAGVTSPYGNRYHPVLKRYIFHAGVDLRARYVPLHAVKQGRISYAGWMSGYGRIIIIKHKDGYESRYAHMKKLKVKVGQRVKKGQLLGQSGMSGRVTGPHLHFEIRKNGKPLDPMKYIMN